MTRWFAYNAAIGRLAALTALLPLALGGCVYVINDITTDLDRPPLYFVSPPEQPAYNAAKYRAIQEQAYPDLKNLTTPWPTDEAFARVLTVIRRREWTIVGMEEKSHRVQAVSVTALLRFRDDVIVEVRTPSGSDPAVKSVIVMRSKSRLGRSDLGANAKRIRAFFHDLQAAP
jgi:uncharacterized protein (DUF1499 family)